MFEAFLVALVVSAIMTPISIKLAPKIGAMDIPKDTRRMHQKPIPRFGGLAIYVGTMVPLLIFLHESRQVLVVMLGGTLIYALGVLDDFFDLPAKLKFCWQTAVAILMYAMGLRIDLIGSLHWQLATASCFIITVLWLVGITNTINLIDGLDGLAAGVAAIASLSVAYVAYIHGNKYGVMIVCVALMALAGASIGFLPFNFNPAKTFMGDGGSLFLGFMLASMSVVGPLRKSTLIALIVPVMVLGIPILDTFLAIVRRLLNHRPIMEADKGHLHHRLMASGMGQRRVVLMIYGISGIMGMAAVLFSRELFKDGMVLLIIALVYIYIFLTDPGHLAPAIKGSPRDVNKPAEEETAAEDGAAEEAAPEEKTEE